MAIIAKIRQFRDNDLFLKVCAIDRKDLSPNPSLLIKIMSEKIDKFCADLRDKLTAVEAKLTKAKESLDTTRETTAAAVDEQVKQAKEKLAAMKKQAEEAHAQLEASADEWAGATVAKIEEWKANREKQKLEHRAEKAEKRAAAAIILAADAVEEAQVAVLEAMAARTKRIMEASLNELFDVKPVQGAMPGKARVLESLTCQACGEATMESRTRRFLGKTLCIPCFEAMEQKR